MTVRPSRRNPEPKDPLGGVSAVSISERANGDLDLSRAMAGARLQPDFEAFYNKAYGSVARALGVTLGDADLGREAADEAMARCFARWSTVQAYDNPAGWVYRVGLNWARSLRIKLNRRRTLPTPDSVPPATVTDPVIQQALQELDLELRAVVTCRMLLDWSTEETATALHLRPGTVKSRLHRALGLLETKLYHLNEGD